MKKIIPFLSFLLILTACEVVFVENISDKKVTLLAPNDNTELSEGVITFYWKSLEDATSYKLRVVIPSFENATQIVLDTTVTSTSFNKELSQGGYQWQVQALNTEYQTDYTTKSFTVNQK